MNDIPRHLCTVSRDITIGALGGFEPATYRLGVAEPPLICDLCGHRGARRSAGTLPWWSVTRPPIHSVPSRRSTSRRLSLQAWEIRALTEAGADAIITSMAELEVHCLQGRRAYRRCDSMRFHASLRLDTGSGRATDTRHVDRPPWCASKRSVGILPAAMNPRPANIIERSVQECVTSGVAGDGIRN
jgi:hypothetical protein